MSDLVFSATQIFQTKISCKTEKTKNRHADSERVAHCMPYCDKKFLRVADFVHIDFNFIIPYIFSF